MTATFCKRPTRATQSPSLQPLFETQKIETAAAPAGTPAAETPLGPVDHAAKTSSTSEPSSGIFNWLGTQRIAVAGCLLGAAITVGGSLASGADTRSFNARAQAWSAQSLFPSQSRACRLEQARVDRAGRAPFGPEARILAREALTARGTPSARHPFMIYQNEIRERLERLGMILASTDHIHISDVDLDHGGAVMRSAAGTRPLFTTVTSTLSVADVPRDYALQHLTPEQRQRLAGFLGGNDAPPPGGPDQIQRATFRDLIADAMLSYEYSILEKMMRLQILRDHRGELPPSARIFVNMSFGTSVDRTAMELAGAMLTAPRGSPLHQLAVKVLGEEPQRPPPELNDGGGARPCGAHSRFAWQIQIPDYSAQRPMPREVARFLSQVARLKAQLIFPAMERAFAEPAQRHIIDTARAQLEAEVARGRAAGILVFEAAGNEYADALAAGRPMLSESSTARIRGTLPVGAIDIRNPRDPHDDRVAVFSAEGEIAFGAPGVRIPVGRERGRATDLDGTSFASPLALSVATAAGTHDRRAPVDRLEQILRDARVARDIPGTTRDGAGVLDPFAAVLLAANPQLTRAQIDDAWRLLGDRRADVAAIRRMLGLPGLGAQR